MAKPHGTYTKLYEGLASHEKTLDLADALAPVLGMSADMCVPFVTHGLFQLACWCIRESESGDVGHLRAAQFARAIDLPPSVRDIEAVRTAWMESGFIDFDEESGDAKLHEFEFYAGSLLADRKRKREKRESAESPGHSAESPGTSEDSRARVRNSEFGRRNKGDTPLPPADEATPAARSRKAKPDPDACRQLIAEHQRRFPSHPRIADPPGKGALTVAAKALKRMPLTDWLAYFEQIARAGPGGWLHDEGNFEMLTRPSIVANWESGQYRPRKATGARDPGYDIVEAAMARLNGGSKEADHGPRIIDAEVDCGGDVALPPAPRNGLERVGLGESCEGAAGDRTALRRISASPGDGPLRGAGW